jgi:SAM-dependent methyltransferase
MNEVAQHYGRADLLVRLQAALRADGADPDRPTMAALAPYDQFHGRGQEATEALADLLDWRASDRVLDIGSGIGGPARYIAKRFGCRVTGIDLTPEFCDVARHLSHALGVADRVTFEVADALAMPFPEGAFDGAYSMNVAMNIADKDAFYREIRRVLKPGSCLALAEIVLGQGGAPDYPTPWAASARTSFLSTPDELRDGLARVGFDLLQYRSTRDEMLAFGASSRAMVERGEKPPHRAVMLMHGELAQQAMANTARALADGRIEPVEILARRGT